LGAPVFWASLESVPSFSFFRYTAISDFHFFFCEASTPQVVATAAVFVLLLLNLFPPFLFLLYTAISDFLFFFCEASTPQVVATAAVFVCLSLRLRHASDVFCRDIR